MTYRIVKDSMGEKQIPQDALWGAQTQRALENFPISGLTLPRAFIEALGLIKAGCAHANAELQFLEPEKAQAIEKAALLVAEGRYDSAFPIDVFQTGSGTSTNMNANEVIAELASRVLRSPLHPNDEVNQSQSSNDVIPTAIHVSSALLLHRQLLPALTHLHAMIEKRSHALSTVTKTGRTHLMDAMPITLGQELSGWAAQIQEAIHLLKQIGVPLQALPIGGTAVGTGVNADPAFAGKVAHFLSQKTELSFTVAANRFSVMSSQHTAVALSSILKTAASSLMKIANDLRWMNSGPLAGLSEISLPALQPGSSIMPGKINPVIPEAVMMVCAQVTGHDLAITIAGQSSNFQLNVMLPLIAYNLLQSLQILSNAAYLLADKAILDFQVNHTHLETQLARNPILITALNTVIGYELGAKIAKKAYQENRPLLEVAKEMTQLEVTTLQKLLDPHLLTQPGIPK